MPFSSTFDSAKNEQLIIFVGDSEAWFETNMLAELTQKLCAERVNCPSFDPLGFLPEVLLQSRCNLTGGFVRKREGANARRIKSAFVDEKADSLDETVSFSRARASEHQQRLRFCLDCSAL